MGTQLVLSFAKRYFFNLSNALNSKHNSQTIRILSPYRNISLFSFVFILCCAETEIVEIAPSISLLFGIIVQIITPKRENKKTFFVF